MRLEKLKTLFKKLNYKNVALGYILIFAIAPIIPRLTSMYLTTYFYMAVSFCMMIFIILFCRLNYIKELFFFVIPFGIYAFLLFVSNHIDGMVIAGYNAVLFMLPVFIGFYLIRNPFKPRAYTIIIIVTFIITALTTIIGCINNPEASRILASTATSQDATAIKYDLMNIGGYVFVYSAVLLYPFAILAFKTKKLHLAFVIPIIILMFLLTTNAEYTYAFLFVLITTAFIFVPRNMNFKSFIALMLTLIIAAIVFKGLVASLLQSIGELIGNEAMTEKMTAIFIGQDALNTLDDNRDQLYMMSIEAFCSHPLLGIFVTGSKAVGGHSFVLDNLGNFGLIGAALMFFMYRGIYRLFYKPLLNKVGNCFVFWLFLQPILLSCINTQMWLNNLCLFAPILLCAIYSTDAYKQSIPDRVTPLIPASVLEKEESA